MRNSIFLIFVSLFIFSCKKDHSKSSEKKANLIRGEFILIDGSGVIKGAEFIYGVVINDMAHQLNEKIKPLQREEYDMVPVVVNGVIKENPEEGWPEVLEITEIISVTKPTHGHEHGHKGHHH